MVAVRQAALVSDESALEACAARDDALYKLTTFTVGWQCQAKWFSKCTQKC